MKQPKKAIIIDVDNTIFSQNMRKTHIIQDVFNLRDVSLEQVINDYSLNFLSNINIDKKEFWKKFLSSDYYSNNDVSNLEIYGDCQRIIETLYKNDITIIYLTARPVGDEFPNQRKVLVNQLMVNNLPVPNETDCFLFMLESNFKTPMSNYEFSSISLNYKKSKVAEIVQSYNVIAGIGDTKEDIDAYNQNGIVSIQYNSHNTKNNQDANLFLSSWVQIGTALNDLLSDVSGSEFSEIVRMHINEYGNWLSDLDAKSRMILVINTALLALCITVLNKGSFGMLFEKLILFSAMFSLLAMIFCIRAFSSKWIRGNRSGETITYSVYNVFKAFFGRTPNVKNSPIDLSDKLKTSSLRQQQVAHLNFFLDHYKTLDLKNIYNLRLFELRALNYVKIYYEIWGRRFTFVSMALIAFGVLCLLFPDLPNNFIKIYDFAISLRVCYQ